MFGRYRSIRNNPYVIGGLYAHKNIPVNAVSPPTAQFPIDVVGPEFVTGSSEWKLEQHKISIKHDFDRHNDTTRKSKGNKMVDMQQHQTRWSRVKWLWEKFQLRMRKELLIERTWKR
jgi:hypothetical protein